MLRWGWLPVGVSAALGSAFGVSYFDVVLASLMPRAFLGFEWGGHRVEAAHALTSAGACLALYGVHHGGDLLFFVTVAMLCAGALCAPRKVWSS